MEPTFFATPADFRRWLERHHADADELVVGFHKVATRKPSITWPEAVDEALCFGWIDGIRRRIDDERYSNRFTPRKLRSNWSAKNVKRAKELIAEGRMTPAGLAAFEARTKQRTGVYSYEQRHRAAFEPAQERRFRANRKAWRWFQDQPPSYRTAATWWVASAKKEETRATRLDRLIEDSEQGTRVPPLAPRPSTTGGGA